jgi:hypothetical protein
MTKRNNFNVMTRIHKVVSEIISIPLAPLEFVFLFSMTGTALMAILAEKGQVTFTMVLPYVLIAAFSAWCVVAIIHAVHGRIFLRWNPEPLTGTRWRTRAGAVGLFKQKNFDGAIVLSFPSGVVAEYKRGALIQED